MITRLRRPDRPSEFWQSRMTSSSAAGALCKWYHASGVRLRGGLIERGPMTLAFQLLGIDNLANAKIVSFGPQRIDRIDRGGPAGGQPARG